MEKTFSAKDLIVGLFAIIGLIAAALIYGYIVWHSFKTPTFLSVKKDCMPTIGEQSETMQESLFGYSCSTY